MKKLVILFILLFSAFFLAGCLDGKKSVGDTCTTNNECTTNNCSAGFCSKSDIGGVCNSNTECLRGYCISNSCTLSGHKGSCVSNADCEDSYSCFENQCIKKQDLLCETNKSVKPFTSWMFLAGLISLAVGFLGYGGTSRVNIDIPKGKIGVFGAFLIGAILVAAAIFFFVLPLC